MDLDLDGIDAPDRAGMPEALLDIDVREKDLKTIRTVGMWLIAFAGRSKSGRRHGVTVSS